MTIAVWILSLLLIAEFVMAPVNLWSGRTVPLFTRFTGYPPQVATWVFAPVKLASVVLVGIGLAVPAVGIAGGAIIAGISAVYLARLAAPGRRDRSGIIGFALFGSWAVVLIVLLAAAHRDHKKIIMHATPAPRLSTASSDSGT